MANHTIPLPEGLDTSLRGRLAVTAKLLSKASSSRLSSYRPHPKQMAFHALGASKRERGLLAGNQLGKTLCAGMETAMHATGLYPEWWTGRRFEGPVRCWVGGPTAEHCRDNPQRILLGPDIDRPGHEGTVPTSRIGKVARASRPSQAVDYFSVEHVRGGRSVISFKTADIENPNAARKRWQGETIDWIWLDEEVPLMIYTEALARIASADGAMILTATPLLGMTDVMRQFYPNPSSPDRGLVMMGIGDALHYTEAQRERVIRSYPAHERDARTQGIPMLGSGRVFSVADEVVLVPTLPIPEHWNLVVGMDFGWGDHATAAVLLAEDRAADCLYVAREYRAQEPSPTLHARALKAWGPELPVAWPHDGGRLDTQGNQTISQLYRGEGLRMFPEHATFPPRAGKPGGYQLQPGITEMLDRMRTGRWKVFESCPLWMEEFRLYHRRDGEIVKKHDDLLSASRYAMMMRRIARPRRDLEKVRQRQDYTGSWDPLSLPGGFGPT